LLHPFREFHVHLEISQQQSPPVSAVSLTGELDLASARQLQVVVATAIRDGCKDVTLHLAEVRFMDMSGVHALAWCRRRLLLAEGRLHIDSSSRAVDRILALAAAA
jgi:stage II sporulation protein AA (anti-sigma F factor antagonist)